MEEIKNGSIRIADEVIADIAIKAAQDVKGVAGVYPRLLSHTKSLMTAKVPFVKGVLLSSSVAGLDLTIQIALRFGTKVQEVCAEVQRDVAEAVSDMTGISVRSVNVAVVDVVQAKPRKKNSK